MAGVRKVSHVHAHAGPRLALAAESQSSFDSCIFKSTVALISIKFVRLSIVGDEKISPAALVLIEHRDAKRF